MTTKLRVLLIIAVLAVLTAIPVSFVLYSGATLAITGGGLVFALIAAQYPLMRYITRNIKVEDEE
jgi:hypothetical protein